MNVFKFTVLLFLFSSSCFAQNKEEEVMIPVSERYNDITADNFVDQMVKEIKRFDEEPRYFIRPIQSNCLFEILVNDIVFQIRINEVDMANGTWNIHNY